ncbi:MAG: class I SAM-dependent methyltransferase [Promethearchaeota archaeon]|nr:MAG: class I SAM-dependent methyltransferase [Candidatus Lokiarchaeota archaeon]
MSTLNTGFRSLTYRSGFVYNWLTKRLYDQKKKFLTISKLIGSHKTVLDLPCGTGYLCRFLDPSTKYIGYDLNHRFLKKLRQDFRRGKIKLKNLMIRLKNIFDFQDYPSNVDVIVFCDILHHIYPNHVDLVENAKKHAKKVIICEPVAVKPKDINAKDKFFNLIMKYAKYLPESMLKWIDFLFFDNDGINSYEEREQWQHDANSLKQMYNRFGIEDKRIYKITDDFIGVWEKNGHGHGSQ